MMDGEIQFKFLWTDEKYLSLSKFILIFNNISISNSDSVGNINMMERLLKAFPTCNYRSSISPLFIGEELQ